MAEIAKRLGGKALAEVAVAAEPDTILRWFRKLVARRLDGSAWRQSLGRPRVEKTNRGSECALRKRIRRGGYDRMVGALANLGHSVSDQRWVMFSSARHCPGTTAQAYYALPRLPSGPQGGAGRDRPVHRGSLYPQGLVTYHVLFFI